MKRKLKNLAKWSLLVIASILLYMAGSRQAFHQRGYEAIGGEIFLLLLPAIYHSLEQMIQDIKEEVRGENE